MSSDAIAAVEKEIQVYDGTTDLKDVANLTTATSISNTGSGNWLEVNTNSVDFNGTENSVEVTGNKSSDGGTQRIYTLSDSTINATIFLEGSGGAFYDGQNKLVLAKRNKTSVWVRYFPRGSSAAGATNPVIFGEYLVTSINYSGDVGGAEQISITLEQCYKATEADSTA